ncbi:MAG: crosslink repair DNA glycosylase YcaQ family protein [Actinomycetota bacterium]|jgi:uncharacterized protein|nr:crosslink repair DNA glycosylase YcaQ family protein [Actinomycetota bacterium]
MRISSLQARRLAISGQGLDRPLSDATPTRHHLRRAMQHLGVLQIDAVNAIARSHLLVLRSRLGGQHDQVRDLLERSAYRHRELAEYWCHEACFVPVDDWPLFDWRMERARKGQTYKHMAKLAAARPDFIDHIENHITEHGPTTAGELEEGGRKGPWWGWSDSKTALEWLFWVGKVSVSHRVNFTRYYDLVERVLPEHTAGTPPTEEEAHRQLLLRAVAHLGVGAAEDLIDYHRLPKTEGRARVAELVEDGELIEATVEGWDRPGYVAADVKRTRRRSRSVLLSPFDPIVWFRPRAERLFGFNYRIEIYVPAAKRVHGYYVLPFLHDDQLRARVDVKADREAGVLRVPGAFAEPGLDSDDGTEALAADLWHLAHFLGLEEIDIGDRGDLAPRLRQAASSASVAERAQQPSGV